MKHVALPLLLFAVTFHSFALDTAAHEDVGASMAAAAIAFLDSLDDGQRARTKFAFEGAERIAWDFVPKQRQGLPIKAMSPAQQKLAMKLLQTALSDGGMKKAQQVMALEQVLHDLENQNPKRDPQMYHFQIFDTPSKESPWGWRVEGHHLSINITVPPHQHDDSSHSDSSDVVVTPAFFGANPGTVRQGPQAGLRVLGKEEDLGRRLVKSLNPEQLARAKFSHTAPRDVINGPGTTTNRLQPAGLAAAAMSNEQQAMLMDIIREYVQNFHQPIAARDLTKIQQAGFEKLHFAWAGGLDAGEKHYFRIQGPTMVFEYDNVQGNGNHVHYVWRDTENDFGADVLKRHYQHAHAE